MCVLIAVTGMSPLSPYLNVDPRYLVQVRSTSVWLGFFFVCLFLGVNSPTLCNFLLLQQFDNVCFRTQMSSFYPQALIKQEEGLNWLSSLLEAPA